ncbi:MAG: bifunctional anthranilate synthase component II/anthranilate phosphoribosyltransferase [Anaerolineae bacterium]
MESLSRKQFCAVAARGRLVPLYRELPADLETPVSVYLKLRGQGPSFLLESVEKAEQVGRYSFLGFNPRRQIVVRGREAAIFHNGRSETRRLAEGEGPLHVVAAELARYQPVAPVREVVQGLPYFFGGAVGYLGYDLVRFFERLPETTRDELSLPDVHLLVTDTLVAFDHVQHRLLLIANAHVPPGSDLDAAYDDALARLNAVEERLCDPLPPLSTSCGPSGGEFTSNMSQERFKAAVRRAQEYIAAGDIFQVVLSQRLTRPTSAEPFDIYRALRRLNPSPYMFFLELGGNSPLHLIGSSPEMLVRLQGRTAEVRPIAGTRPRGRDEQDDRALEADLLADPKERAEHVMLVDLGRNDLGRVCRFGTIEVPDLITVERYSHVIHLVSRVTGQLRDGVDGYDLLRATFPAGTVSGAPKVRAMEIIEELEEARRGPYAGAVGYFGFNGNMDTCITIRTIVMQNGVVYLQAGAGIVADSDPGREWEETRHKARALALAVEMAERGPTRQRSKKPPSQVGGPAENGRGKVLVIDNYDSFTYNLVQYLGELGAEPVVRRNDAVTLEEIRALAPSHIVISPGPGTPDDGGISLDVIRTFHRTTPILGVCLGHQCIVAAFGGQVRRAPRLMHGKTSRVYHEGRGILDGVPSPFSAMRYHSLIAYEPLPDCLKVIAATEEGEVMALEHKAFPTVGLQFHPESILTEHGKKILRNFLTGFQRRKGMIRETIHQLLEGQSLPVDQAEAVMDEIMTGAATPAQIAGFLVALRTKGETADEIVGCARAMRRAAVPVCPRRDDVVDTCGTGGDRSGTFNISTTTAFVVAGAGLGVAKHGNRSVSSQSGSADVLEALGVNLSLTPEQVAQAIDEIGVGFIFAPNFHPAMRYAIGPRRELGVRTVFNLLGPLTNPAGASAQLLGVYDGSLTEVLARVLQQLGSRAAYVVHGFGGLDELTTSGPNRVSCFGIEPGDGRVVTKALDPRELGFAPARPEDLRGGTPEENARIMRAILSGQDRGPRRDVVLLNAAAALVAGGKAADLREGVARAADSIDGGAALRVLEGLIAYSRSLGG